ncbi:MAG TPA: YciI family protein [Terriglobales bacterium]|nr:YciI family protein [Terriglobales bacterium]
MKYMLMFTSDGDGMDSGPPEAVQAMYAKVGEWWSTHSASGALLDGHQLQPASTATTVDPRTGVVTDGPFLESKESIGGYGIVEAPDLDTVIAMARTWPASAHVEIRPIVEQPGM